MNNQQPKIWDVLDQIKGVPTEIGAVATQVEDLATEVTDLKVVTEAGLQNVTASLEKISKAVENGSKQPGTLPAEDTLIGLCCLCLLAGPDGRWERDTPVGGVLEKAELREVKDFDPKVTPDEKEFTRRKKKVQQERVKLSPPELQMLLDEPVLDLLRLLASRIFNPAASSGSTSP